MSSSAPAPVQTTPAAVPGKGLGIAGLVLAFLVPLVGLILSIIAKSQSKKAGYPNGPATAGIWISIVLMVLGAILIGISIWLGVAATNNVVAICNELGEGVWEVDGVTYTCG
ncbi:hypothetical protein [Naasia sp. SYSU D00948]|uniref:hypothetical protein n=1 Tax=Naasia sp. SYSU D00948 TaxID=2817379 RepID=UPI001B312200|nr:hypothetical protein [Naasia sp. SYSU D00948]